MTTLTTTLRSLFTTLKARRLVFVNPMRGIKAGVPPVRTPQPLTGSQLGGTACREQ